MVCAGGEGDIRKVSTAFMVHNPSRRHVRRVKRLSVDSGPMSEYVRGGLQTLVAGDIPGPKYVAQGYKVHVVAIGGGGVGYRVDEAVVVGLGIGQARGPEHGLIRHQIPVYSMDK